MSSKDPNDLLFAFDSSVSPSELHPFAPGEMVRCEECLRANSPTRVACLYCGAALPATSVKTAAVQAAARTPDQGEPAFNLILTSGSTISDDSIEKAAAILRLNANELTRIVQAEVALPVARAASHEDAEEIKRALLEFGWQTQIVSDESLAIESSPQRRLRTVEIHPDHLVVYPTTGEEKHFAWTDLNLLISARIFTTQVEVKERKRRGGSNSLLDSSETTADEAVLDLYTQNDAAGWRILANNFDFSFLSKAKSLVAGENFNFLLRSLREHAPAAEFDDTYVGVRRSLELVWPSPQQKSSRGWRRERAGKYSTNELAVTTNESQFTRYSRLRRLLKSAAKVAS